MNKMVADDADKCRTYFKRHRDMDLSAKRAWKMKLICVRFKFIFKYKSVQLLFDWFITT